MVVRFLRPQLVAGVGYFNAGETGACSDALARRFCELGAAERVAPVASSPEERPPIMQTAYDRPPVDKMVTRAPRRKGGRHAQ